MCLCYDPQNDDGSNSYKLLNAMNEHLEGIPLFGGLAGARLGVDKFEVCKGLVLRRTYAHVMSPYILAFQKPERPGSHHPGPWKPAQGGIFMDVEIEVALDQDVRPTGFDRLNTLWWTLTLLRLSTGAKLRMPVVSDTSFANVTKSSVEPILWPIETLPRQILTVPDPPEVIDEERLVWVRESFVPGSELMNDEPFGRAFQAFDDVIWAHSAGSAIVVIWAALETLVRPGREQITKRLSSSLATLVEPPGAGRDRLFQRLTTLYEARGSSAHASRSPQAQQLLSSFDIARRSFIACIDNREVPNGATLHQRWRLNQ